MYCGAVSEMSQPLLPMGMKTPMSMQGPCGRCADADQARNSAAFASRQPTILRSLRLAARRLPSLAWLQGKWDERGNSMSTMDESAGPLDMGRVIQQLF